VLDLVLGDAAIAWHHLHASLEAGHADRADLWGYFGDAWLLRGRLEEANAAYVRALVLDAGAVDLVRLRSEPLRRLHEELRASVDAERARQTLLVRAWARGVLQILPGNDWLEGRTAGLLARAEADPASPPARRSRRFALLFYLDRTDSGQLDVARREAMAALDPRLFAEFMTACRERERR
jgi:hypothetical protein